MSTTPSRTQRSRGRLRGSTATVWAPVGVEGVIALSSLLYVLASSYATLVLWLSLGSLYVVGGFIAVSRSEGAVPRAVGSSRDRWTWTIPLLASAAGAVSAVTALTSDSPAFGNDKAQALVASMGVVLSWILLHTGVARIYRSFERRKPGGLSFPGTDAPGLIDYLYFSFTIATAFATSDVVVRNGPMRRAVLVHSVVSFFYNALVVAVAFQVLQKLLAA